LLELIAYGPGLPFEADALVPRATKSGSERAQRMR